MIAARILALLLMHIPVYGCSYYIPKPSPAFPISSDDVRAELVRMKDNPVELRRPVVVIDGWFPVGGGSIKAEIRRLTGAPSEQIELIGYAPGKSLEQIADLVVRKVESTWPSDDPSDRTGPS